MSLGAASRGNEPALPVQEPGHGYRLLDRIGGRDRDEVWRAEAPDGRRVALRFLPSRPQVEQVERSVLRLLKTAQHPNLVLWLGAWRTNGFLVLASELADRSLKDRHREAVARGEPGLPRDDLLAYLADVAAGLDYLGAPRPDGASRPGRPIQHRAVRPSNLLLFGARAKLGDLGLAWLREPGDLGLGGRGAFAYAAPEVLKREPSARSDQYALAVTWYQLRTGALPFGGGPTDALVGHLVREPDLSLLPEAERPAVARALAKDPAERWPDCRSFIEALRSGSSVAPAPQGPALLPKVAGPGPGLTTAAGEGDAGPPDEAIPTAGSSPDPASGPTASGGPEADTHPGSGAEARAAAGAEDAPRHPAARRPLAFLGLAAAALLVGLALEVPLPTAGTAPTQPAASNPAPTPLPVDPGTIARWPTQGVPEPAPGEAEAEEPERLVAMPLAVSDATFARVLDDFVATSRPEPTPAPSTVPAAPTWDPAVELVATPAPPPELVPPTEFPRHEADAGEAPVAISPEVPASELVAERSDPAGARNDEPRDPEPPSEAEETLARWLGPWLSAGTEGEAGQAARELRIEVPEAPPILAGETAELPVTIDGADGAGPVRLRVEGLPAGLSVRVATPPGPSGAATLALTVADAAEPGDRAFRLVAEGEAAYGQAEVGVRVRPRSAEALNGRGVERYRAGRFADAVADFGAALRLDPAHGPALRNRAAVRWQLGRYDDAIADLDAALRLDPADAVALNNRGLSHRARGDHARALADYDAALRLDPADARLHYNRASLLDALGRDAEARAGYAEALRRDPGHARSRQALDRLDGRPVP